MTPDPIKQAGDSALLLEIGDRTISPATNRRAVAIARNVRGRAIAGVRDVVSTFRSVAVFFDPLATDVEAVAAALHEAQAADVASDTARTLDVPVIYGGESGPDLDEVAAFARCSRDAVIERHTRTLYRVYMLGFLPGFPYMAHVDPTIAAPRRSTPRVRVAAGSVGIAGVQTGIYPCDSPGGWQIIGRTPITLFDSHEIPPALLAPGDSVRFVRAEQRSAAAPRAGTADLRRRASAGTGTSTSGRAVTVLRPGLLTTVQDLGRWGYQQFGVPVSGCMDQAAHRIANTLVGNPANAATLEATLAGPVLRMEQDTHIAIAGADMRATVDGVAVPLSTRMTCARNSVLRFGERTSGVRTYIAFDGGIDVEPELGSRATHLLSGLGGLHGRAVKADDRLPLGEPGTAKRTVTPPSIGARGGARVRVLPGPQADYFDRSALDTLQRSRFTITPQSDRMGYRLSGTAIGRPVHDEMISDVTFVGGVQIPPSGHPILLMTDRQTTGGYPQLAVVISADLPGAAQLAPGDWIEFEVCRRDEAIAALVAAEGRMLALQ
jgi:KipI family sensor histidine kinase inhibitor